MRSFTFQKPVGTDAETDHVIRQQDRAQNELQLFDSTTVKVEHTTRGIRLHAKFPPIPAQNVPEAFYPFRIYKPKKEWLATSGWTFQSYGAPVAIAINPNVPTNLPHTINPNTDMWRIWAVRTGLIGANRGTYFVSFDEEFFFPGLPMSVEGQDFSVITEVGDGCDRFGVSSQTGTPYDANPDDYPDEKVVPIVLPSNFGQPITNFTPLNGLAISVLVPQDGSPITLWGVVFNNLTQYNNVFSPPASGDRLFPIGVIDALGYDWYHHASGDNAEPTAYNLQFGNITNLFGVFQNNQGNSFSTDLILSLTKNYRGDFLNDPIQFLAFYPGDCVKIQSQIDLSASSISTVHAPGTGTVTTDTSISATDAETSESGSSLFVQNIYMMTAIGFTSDPTTDPNWVKISGIDLSSQNNPTPNT